MSEQKDERLPELTEAEVIESRRSAAEFRAESWYSKHPDAWCHHDVRWRECPECLRDAQLGGIEVGPFVCQRCRRTCALVEMGETEKAVFRYGRYGTALALSKWCLECLEAERERRVEAQRERRLDDLAGGPDFGERLAAGSLLQDDEFDGRWDSGRWRGDA